MIAAIITGAVRLRWLVALTVLAGVVASAFALRNAPLDAIPDISDPQIIVYAKWSRSPEIIERDVTDVLVKSLVGTSGVRAVRATTHMGYSFIYVILDAASRRDAVQSQVADKLSAVRPMLPPDAFVSIGPDASSMGWIYQFALVDRQHSHDPRELRQLNETVVRPALRNVPGVAEVASVGGLEKQYQFKVFPPLLADAGLTMGQVIESLKTSFADAGGRTLEVTSRDYQISGSIASGGVDAIEQTIVGRSPAGAPVLLKDIGYIQVGYDQRRGIADLNGRGEVVGGIVVMQQGGNVLSVANAIKARMAAVRSALPSDVSLVTTYDRSTLIWATVRHFLLTLAYELAVVILVTVLFLQNARASVAPVAVMLLGVILTALPMWVFNQTINLFSLAGLFIAIGEMVDATIVIVENSSAELALHPNATKAERRSIVLRSITAVARPLIFSLLIILASFLPVFFLNAKEARMFDSLALSKTFAMVFSTLLTLLLLPSIVLWAQAKGRVRTPGWVEEAMVGGYRRLLTFTVRLRYWVLGGSLALLVVAGFALTSFKSDFMPKMEEGSLLFMPTTLPGVPAREAGWVLQQIDKKIAAFPEVAAVFGKLGRADTATDAAPVSMIEATVTLRPRSQWRPGMTKDRLVAELDNAMKVVGWVNMWVQPISARVMMQDSGIQTPVGLKIKGPDLAQIEAIGQQVEQVLKSVPGTRSVVAERISSGYFIDVRFDRAKLAAAGLPADEAMLVPRFAIGGDNVATVRDDDGLPSPLSLQYAPEYLDSLEKLREAPIAGGNPGTTLSDVAEVGVRKMPDMVRNDNGQPAGFVFVYLDGKMTPTDYVAKARGIVAGQLHLPSGYVVEWTGDYEYVKQANDRFRIIVPVTIAIIFLLLVMAFRRLSDSLLILLSVPFAMIGGVFLQWALGYTMTTAVVVGYIALFAVAIQTGIIMLIFIRQSLARREASDTFMSAVLAGSVLRLRPKLMTVAATTLSLLPILLSSGPGIEIMQPIAAPTVGGMVTSTIYVLFLIPCLFAIGEDIRRWRTRGPAAGR